ncbi:MAG: hypothetical protein AB1714_00790 [Acidobacteriota bacterium]
MGVQPSFLLLNVLVLAVPFLAYFAGIIVRKKAMPGPNSPPLRKQLLLGIPLSLLIVSPVLAAVRDAIVRDLGTYLFTLGVLMEQGMIVQETATERLARLKAPKPAVNSAAGG